MSSGQRCCFPKKRGAQKDDLLLHTAKNLDAQLRNRVPGNAKLFSRHSSPKVNCLLQKAYLLTSLRSHFSKEHQPLQLSNKLEHLSLQRLFPNVFIALRLFLTFSLPLAKGEFVPGLNGHKTDIAETIYYSSITFTNAEAWKLFCLLTRKLSKATSAVRQNIIGLLLLLLLLYFIYKQVLIIERLNCYLLIFN